MMHDSNGALFLMCFTTVFTAQYYSYFTFSLTASTRTQEVAAVIVYCHTQNFHFTCTKNLMSTCLNYGYFLI